MTERSEDTSDRGVDDVGGETRGSLPHHFGRVSRLSPSSPVSFSLRSAEPVSDGE